MSSSIEPQPAAGAAEALSSPFGTWLDEEIQALVDACSAAEAENFSIQSRQGIYLSAHTLKGEASALGQPQIAKLAVSLCCLLSQWVPSGVYRQLTIELVSAIDGIYRREAPDIADRIAQALVVEIDERIASLLGDPPAGE